MPRNFIRAVILDLGGTLMYGRRNWTPVMGKADDVLTEHLRAQGMEVNPSTFPIEFRKNLDQYFKQRETDLLETTYMFVLRDLLSQKGYDVTSDVLRSALDELFAITQTNWELESDAIPTLEKLEQDGYRLGIISNAGDDKDVQQLVQGFGIRKYFDFVLTSAACSYRKPHPRIFEIALSNWYLLPSEAVMVGDNLIADVQGAQNTGIYGVWLSRRADPVTEEQAAVKPDASLSSLAELPEALDHLQVK